MPKPNLFQSESLKPDKTNTTELLESSFVCETIGSDISVFHSPRWCASFGSESSSPGLPSVLHAPSHTISHLHQSPNRSQVLGHSGKLFFYISFSGDLISQPNWFRFGGERKYPDMTETHLVCLFILRKPSDKNDIDTFMFFGRVVCDTPRRMAKNFLPTWSCLKTTLEQTVESSILLYWGMGQRNNHKPINTKRWIKTFFSGLELLKIENVILSWFFCLKRWRFFV